MKVLITGASRGIGLAIAMEFAKNGHEVAISSRSQEKLKQARESILEQTPAALVSIFTCDAAQNDEVTKLAQNIISQWGGCDVLVNNAGVFIPGNLQDEEQGKLQNMMDINLYSTYNLTRALLPMMINKKQGHIFNICSVAALKAYDQGGSYSITKFAMHGFSQNLRHELKNSGVRVTSVHPGATLTDSWGEIDFSEERLMPPEDVAKMVYAAFELSPRTVVEDIVLRPQKGDL